MEVKNNPQLDIATANSRKAKKWKNGKTSWAEILDNLSKTTVTPETAAEYKKMSRDQQADIKDVGAFVGGYCNQGSRSNIRHRSILTLDADFAGSELWSDYCMIYGNAAAEYSTHKHTPEAPRLRLVIPLSRNVSPDEYEAIGRRVAADLGIDQFDDSTYQPQRCMFWPSTSKDAEFLFEYIDGPVLDPDEVLQTYHDWKDVSAWPMSSRVSEIIRKDAQKQADPLTKSGLVGAFCRAYSIQEAIAAFIPAYAPCDEPGRYTYIEGSTAAGVIIYEDKFSYSFHATDPASGKLCNAWDLVRLHKFAARDEGINPETPVNRRPSWQAMTELVLNDSKVKAQILADRVEDFDDEIPEDGDDWKGLLKITKDGSVASTIDNVVQILEHDERLSGRLIYDEMRYSIIATQPLPWRKDPGPWSDSDDAALRFFLEKMYGLSGKDKIFDAVNVVAMEHKVHPVRDYLNSLSWDGVRRVDSLLIDYLGAEDSDYTRAVTRKALVAAVARIFRPGCKFDYMLTLRGRQGLGKSALIRKLGGKWFSDSFSTVQGKEAYEQVLGNWLIEVGELAGMKKAEAEIIKLFISKQVDRFRPAYGRRTQEYPRQCIFIGTTNESQFLRDTTGNRRFWVVDTPNDAALDLWEDLTQETVDLIWAEAVLLYQAGEDLYLSGELEAEARRVQAAYEEESPKAGMVAAYLDRLLPEGWEDMDLFARRAWLESDAEGTQQRATVCSVEVYAEALGGNPERLDRYAIKEINDIMCALEGWRRMGSERITVKPYGRQRFYRREA